MEFAAAENENRVVCLAKSLKCVSRLMTTLRDKNTDHHGFVLAANRLMSLICEEGLSHLQQGLHAVDVQTPTNCSVSGIHLDTDALVAVSVIRAGDAMLDCLLRLYPDVRAGKILIQRNEQTAQAELFYHKLPDLKGKQVILVDPMLATGGSAKMAIEVLIAQGASEDRIAFFNVVCCPKGVQTLLDAFPKLTIITGQIDEGLNEKAYIIPGLGDYGDRFYGTH